MNEKARNFARKWPVKWFGFWGKELDVTKEDFSLDSHVDPTWLPDDRIQLIEYIRNSPIVVVTQNSEGKCGLCDAIVLDSCYRSDGEWLWIDSLAHLVEKHFFILPNLLVEHIRSHRYKYPDSITTSIKDLPWP